MRLLAAAAISAVLAACSGEEPERAVRPPPFPPPAVAACRNAPPVNVVFLVRQEAPEEISGFNVFVADWGRTQGCFRGTVLTSLQGADLSRFQVLIVDAGHDQVLSPQDIAAVHAFVRSGKRVGLFGWPLKLPGGELVSQPFGDLPGLFGDATLIQADGCGDWQYSDALRSPFALQGAAYRYENFGDTIFTIAASTVTRVWASSLFCPAHPGPVMVETAAGTLAGFSIAYSISLADNNVRSVGMKQLVVDTIRALSGPPAG